MLNLLSLVLAAVFTLVLRFFFLFLVSAPLLYCVWEFAMRAIWPSLPPILWWQFGLLAFGLDYLISALKGNVFKVEIHSNE